MRMPDRPTLLVNHLGYNLASDKVALLAVPVGQTAVTRRAEATLVPETGGPIALTIGEGEVVAGWGETAYHRIDFSVARTSGRHELMVCTPEAVVCSVQVVIGDDRLQSMTIADITAYFRSARSSGEIDRKDAHARFYDDESGREVDARGGWLDASGDYSKFLSHLTYTRMMSPQQIPLCAWALLTARDELKRRHPGFVTSQHARLRDEGLFGADFLVRFQSPEGYFYTAIFDALTKDLDQRVITAPLQDSVRTTRWQAAYRHGGGMAIAALAYASTLETHGDFGSRTYLDAALRGFEHLEAHNTEYLFDGQESVIDDYCALMAASELVGALRQAGESPNAIGRVQRAARRRAESMIGRMRVGEDGRSFLVGDAAGRPFFHAAESGLPVIALVRFAVVLPDDPAAASARAAAVELMRSSGERIETVSNPFGYPRQLVQSADDGPHEAFFYPHENETGYWWQGENANLGSLAYAATIVADLDECDSGLRRRLHALTDDTVAWVLGRNPFDSCMLQGRGRNNVEYSGRYQNSPGGIVNGITSGFDDESAIAFLPDRPGEEWRWAEQWIPHTGWFVLAVSAAR